MQQVYTPYGPGEIVESKTLRGHTSHRVAGNGFDVWLDAVKLGFAPVDEDNSVDLPYDPTPQYGVGPLNESTIQPIHEIDADERTSPADSLSFEDRSESEAGRQPGPNPDLFAKSSAHYAMGIDIGAPTPHQTGPYGLGHDDPEHFDYAHPDMVDHDDPRYENNPAYRGLSAEDHAAQDELHQRWQDAGREGNPDPREFHQLGYRTADVLEGAPTHYTPDFIVNDTDDEHLQERWDLEDDDRETTDPDGIVHFSNRHTANPLLMAVPAVAEALGGAAEGGAAAQVARGAGGQAAGGLLDKAKGHLDKADEATDDAPKGLPLPDLGYGWGDLIHASRPAGLDDRYADIVAAHDPYDKVAQFRHDPEAYINRVGHSEFEGLGPRMAQYMDMVEGDAELRTAAWKDVRAKAMRLRREGRVHVKDVGDDRIYASVEGDHGTYDVMIKKGGSFAGFGGGHAVSNWHCACEWGKWAFQRRYTMIGRLCSHGYASYMEMQSAHMKGKKRTTKYPKVQKRASDQNESDWTVDGNVPTGDLNKLRQWAEQPHDTWNGRQQEHNEDVRETIEHAREEGVDTDQLVASLIRRADGAASASGIRDLNTETGQASGPGQWGAATPSSAATSGQATTEHSTSADQRAPETTVQNSQGWNQGPAQAGASGSATLNNDTGQTSVDKSWGGGKGGDSAGALQTPSTSGGIGATPPAGGTNGGTSGGSWMNQSPESKGGEWMNGSPSSMYTVKPGDTLSGIADSHGGGDYNNITNVGGGKIENKDLITPGQTLSIPGGGSSSSAVDTSAASGVGSGTSGGGALSSPSASWSDTSSSSSSGAGSNAASGGALKTTQRRRADWARGDSGSPTAALATPGAQPGAPVAPGAAPAVNPAATSTTPHAGTGAAPGPVTDGAAKPEDQSGLQPSSNDVGGTGSSTGTDATSGGLGGFNMGDIGSTIGDIGGAVSDGIGAIGDVAGSIGGALGGILGMRELEADRDWFEAAYPDAKFHDHKPFNGSGGYNIEEWGTSKENVKDNYSDDREDVTAEPKKTFIEDMGSVEDQRVARSQGIGRLGSGPKSPPVVPEVVREQRPNRPGAVIEAHIDDDFDPYQKTAADFGGEFEGRDIVAEFQRQADASGSAITSQVSSFDDFSSSPAIRQAMQRTAGRNYSLAEQSALVREGDIGGAGNLGSLDLKGTHYEAMNSTGLW